MNTTNKNLLQNNHIPSSNDLQPHFQTVRIKQNPKLREKITLTNQNNHNQGIKNIPVHGVYKFPVVQRSCKSVQSVEDNAKISFESLKNTFKSNRSTTKSLLSLLKNSSSTNEFTINRSVVNSKSSYESDHFFSETPKNVYQTPGCSKIQLEQKSSRNKNSSGNHFKIKKHSSGRTPKSSSSAVSDSNHVVIAITEGRGQARGEVGIAAIDIKRPHLILCQISDTQTYANTLRKINILNPSEILLPNTFYDSINSCKLYQMINDYFPNVNLLTVQRKFFNDTNGLQQIKNLCLPDYSSVLLVIFRKFYALAAAAAILKYAEFEQNIIFSMKSIRVNYESGDNITFIDLDTAQKLELVTSQNLGNNSSEDTLFEVLNHCNTLGGQRRLRALILQPLNDKQEICKRLDCVQELIESTELFFSLKKILPKFWDIEQLLSLCAQIPNLKDNYRAAELQINYALLLKTSLESIPVLQKAIHNTKAEFFRSFQNNLYNPHYEVMLNKIYETLNDDAHLSQKFDINLFQRCFCIKTGINAFLDIARLAYTELVQDFNEIVEDLIKEYKLPIYIRTLRNKGPVLQMKLTGINSHFNINNLPIIFIQVQKSRSVITMTTKELLFLKERMNHFVQEIQLLSSIVIFEMLQEIREYIGSLYVLCENIAELDVIVSFAQMGKNFMFTRPTFSDDSMNLVSSVHPILYRISHSKPIPNDVIASVNKNVSIITGPNMGGKSIYIRQVVLLQIMAQIGCYVPAESAKFRITDRIFSRISFNDSVECNASSFILEIKEMQYIIKSITPYSIVIIDELCRGTSTEEGTALAWAILEELLATTAFIFFTTHFWFLTKLQDFYCNVLNYHFQALEIDSDEKSLPHLIYTHRLLPGVIKLDYYGLKLAKNTAIPDSVLKLSENIAKTLNSEWKSTSNNNEDYNENKIIDNIILKLLEMLDNGTLTICVVKNIIEHVSSLNLHFLKDNTEDIVVHHIENNDHTHTLEQIQINEPETTLNVHEFSNFVNLANDEISHINNIPVINLRKHDNCFNTPSHYTESQESQCNSEVNEYMSDLSVDDDIYNNFSSNENKFSDIKYASSLPDTAKSNELQLMMAHLKQPSNDLKEITHQINNPNYSTPYRTTNVNNNMAYINQSACENSFKITKYNKNSRILHSL